MKSSLIEEAAAVESGGMRHPAGGKAVAVENWINSDSIAVRVTGHSSTTFDTDHERMSPRRRRRPTIANIPLIMSILITAKTRKIQIRR